MKLFPARSGLMLVVLGVSTMFACPGIAQAKGAKSWSGPDRRARPGIGYFANQPTTARASTNGSRSFNGRVGNGGGMVAPSVPQAVPPAATAAEGIVRQFPRTAPVAAPRTPRSISGDAVVVYPPAPSPMIVSGRSVSGPLPVIGERIVGERIISERVITPGVVAGQPSPLGPVAVPTQPGRALTSAPVVTESAE